MTGISRAGHGDGGIDGGDGAGRGRDRDVGDADDVRVCRLCRPGSASASANGFCDGIARCGVCGR
jgi:hypothetical protein